jgi:hypothetical protein
MAVSPPLCAYGHIGCTRMRGRLHGKKISSLRELINTGSDKRYVRRDAKGQFKESDDVGRSLAADRRQHAKAKAPKGQDDRGDR